MKFGDAEVKFGDNDQQSAGVPRLPGRFASAVTNPLSPSDLMISSKGSAVSDQEPGVASTIAFARINRLPLLHWLIAAINDLLVGNAPTQHRPAGMLLECGRFVAAGSEIWTHDWYGHGRRCLLARCADAASAEELAVRLNRLLRP